MYCLDTQHADLHVKDFKYDNLSLWYARKPLKIHIYCQCPEVKPKHGVEYSWNKKLDKYLAWIWRLHWRNERDKGYIQKDHIDDGSYRWGD